MKVNSILLKTAAGIILGVVLFVCLLADPTSSLLLRPASAAKNGAAKTGDDDQGQIHQLGLAPYDEGFVISEQEGQIACRRPTPEEAQAMTRRDHERQLQVITPATDDLRQQQTGLKIILRGTAQLDGFPAARDAFLKAAATWEALIQTPITVIIDVDFGPMRFGEPFGSNTIGSTAGQILTSPSIYPSLRSRLIARASGAQEAALYNALPNVTIPTDLGSTAAVSAPSALFRALDFINATADPATETFGPPPTIGFNSAFNFDFDPSDGIGSNKIDFDGTAVHEIGHLLGFTSNVGVKELDPNATIRATVWDLYRFRPGVNLSTFPTAERILSSGGDQIFFDSGADLALSTGRINGEGGDGKQAAHWKADDLTGKYIGIMDPTISRGERGPLTDNDLRAIDVMGYQLRTIASQPATAPVISLAPATVDFGVVSANTRVDRIVAVRNTGTAVLNITGINSLAPNFSVVAVTNSFAVAPGGQETIIVRFNATGAGNQAGTISIASNDPARVMIPVQVKATVGAATLTHSTVSAASFSGAALASEAIVAAFGQSLATRLEAATTLPLPITLGGAMVRVRDSAGTQRDSPLFFASPGQINYQIPAGTENGAATVTVVNGAGAVSTSAINITSVAPGLFAASANGQGVAAALVLRVRANGSQSFEPVARFDAGQNRFVSVPIDLAPAGDQVFLLLFGTGFRFRSNLSAVSVKIGGVDCEVSFAGPQGGFVGVDQINARLSPNLIGRGEVDLMLNVDGRPANTLRVSIK